MAAPVELPNGAFVKLSSCGMALDRAGSLLDPSRRLFSAGNVIVAFNPAGQIDRVYRGSPRVQDQNWAASIAGTDQDIDGAAIRSSFNVRGPMRIDLADGSPLKPTNAQRLVMLDRKDRNSKPILATWLEEPLPTP